jgi:hypothetical protein
VRRYSSAVHAITAPASWEGYAEVRQRTSSQSAPRDHSGVNSPAPAPTTKTKTNTTTTTTTTTTTKKSTSTSTAVSAEASTTRRVPAFDKVVAGLIYYRKLHGHTNVQPHDFVVPTGDGWPEITRGFKLAAHIRNLRCANNNEKLSAEKFAKLDNVGFIWDVYEWRWATVVIPALRMWMEVHGPHAYPRCHDAIPDADDDPVWGGTAFSGLKIGLYCQHIRLGSTRHPLPPWVHAEVGNLGLPIMDAGETKWERAVPLLEQYVAIHGTAVVPPDVYVVPAEAPWPPEMWGEPLGELLRLSRRSRRYIPSSTVDALNAAGMLWKVAHRKWYHNVAAIVRWKELHGEYPSVGDVTPKTDDWIPALQGIKVGNVVQRIRSSREPAWVAKVLPELIREIKKAS